MTIQNDESTVSEVHVDEAGSIDTPVPRARPHSVADLMQRDVITIAPDAPLRELIRVLRGSEISGLPVVDDEGVVVGTVSSTDLLWFAVNEDDRPGPRFIRAGDLTDSTVREIMTPDVFGVPPDASLSDLRRFFARTGVHRALVLDNGKMVGIVALSDVLDSLV